MRFAKRFELPALLFVIIFIAFVSCDKIEEKPELIKESVAESTAVESDTTEIQGKEIIKPEAEQIEESKTEIENRLEDLLTLIEKKEKALVAREEKALKMEKKLGLRASELSEKEASLKLQQYVAWIVFAVGLIALVIAIILILKTKAGSLDKWRKEAEKKNKYLKNLDDQLKQWEKQIEELRKKAESAKGQVKEEYFKQIDSLNKKKEDAKTKLQNLKAANEEAWADLKKIVDAAWSDLEKSIKRVASKIK
jgi:hypothetical protein